MSKNFKNLLKQRKITINSIATTLGISSTTLYYFRDDKCSLTTKKLNALAEYLNVSTDYLLDKTDIPTPENALANYNDFALQMSEREKIALETLKQLNDNQLELAINIMKQLRIMNEAQIKLTENSFNLLKQLSENK